MRPAQRPSDRIKVGTSYPYNQLGRWSGHTSGQTAPGGSPSWSCMPTAAKLILCGVFVVSGSGAGRSTTGGDGRWRWSTRKPVSRSIDSPFPILHTSPFHLQVYQLSRTRCRGRVIVYCHLRCATLEHSKIARKQDDRGYRSPKVPCAGLVFLCFRCRGVLGRWYRKLLDFWLRTADIRRSSSRSPSKVSRIAHG